MWREEHKEVLQVLADVFLDQGQAEKAVILLEALQALGPPNLQVIRALSYAYLAAGRYEDTLQSIDTLLRLGDSMTDNAQILLIRAKALGALGRDSEASDSLSRYLELGGEA